MPALRPPPALIPFTPRLRYRWRSRRFRALEWVAQRAWIGWRRRVGVAYWTAGPKGVPLFSQRAVPDNPFRARGELRWIRIPGTGITLATYRRSYR